MFWILQAEQVSHDRFHGKNLTRVSKSACFPESGLWACQKTDDPNAPSGDFRGPIFSISNLSAPDQSIDENQRAKVWRETGPG